MTTPRSAPRSLLLAYDEKATVKDAFDAYNAEMDEMALKVARAVRDCLFQEVWAACKEQKALPDPHEYGDDELRVIIEKARGDA